MSRNVLLSRRAENNLEKLFAYLSEQWSERITSEFILKLERSIELIKEYPESFPESTRKPGLHKCVVTKHTSLYYRFDSQHIRILTIWDNRQNPEKTKI